MRRSLIFILVSGAVIIGGAIASTMVELDCTQCSAGEIDCVQCMTILWCPRCSSIGAVTPDCPECGGLGMIVKSTGAFISYLNVECGCRGKNPECPICGGKGWYTEVTTGVCEVCQGRGGKPCPHCGGDGKIQLREKAIGFLKR